MRVMVERQSGNRLVARTETAVVVVDRPAAEAGEPGVLRSVELLLAGLGTCMVGTMLSFAEREGIPVEDVRVELKPVMALRPERISRIRMTLEVGGDVTEPQLEALRDAAQACKVHNTLHAGSATELLVRRAAATSR